MMLVTARRDGQVSLWGVNLMLPPTFVTMIGISPAVNEGMLGHAEIARIVHGHALTGMRMSPDARRLLTHGSSVIEASPALPIPGSGTETARLWDTVAQRELARLIPETPLTAAAFSDDGAYLATAFAQKGTVRVWRAASRLQATARRPVRPAPSPAPAGGGAASYEPEQGDGADLTPDATLLAVVSEGKLQVHDLERGEDRPAVPLELPQVSPASDDPGPDAPQPGRPGATLTLSPDGRFVLHHGAHHTTLRDVVDGRSILTRVWPGRAPGSVLDPSGEAMAVTVSTVSPAAGGQEAEIAPCARSYSRRRVATRSRPSPTPIRHASSR